jgi:hypothetical protein
MKKRFLIAGIAAAAVFATVLGVAASITVTSDNLGAGGASVSSCDSNVGTSYVLRYDPTPTPGFVVDKVVVTGVDSSCANQQLTVVLTGSGGSSLASQATPVPSGGGNVTLDFATEPKASDVLDVHVAITGAP